MLDKGVPRHFRLSVSDVPESYDGRLYFLIGPGLGDTVNGFRIFHEVVYRYPRSQSVVYLDPRWKSLYPLIPELSSSEVRYYPEAPSAESNTQSVQPFHRTLQEVIAQMVAECKENRAYIAMAGFKLADRLPQKQTSLAMLARAIGLSLPRYRQRPYAPLTEENCTQARCFLAANGLQEKEYVVIAPSTWPDKMWPAESWTSLIERIYCLFKLQTLIMGGEGCQDFDRPFVRLAMNLPLGTVTALIASARCYIGLDSGLTHVAACSDVPLVTLNPQGKYPPFCIEPHSPFRWTYLSPFVYGRDQIPADSVAETVGAALRNSIPSSCPLCEESPYVLGFAGMTMLFLCRCGLVYRTSAEVPLPPAQTDQVSAVWVLPSTVSELNRVRRQVAEMLKNRNQYYDRALDIRFEHWDPTDTEPSHFFAAPGQPELWWTWDAACTFVVSCGWQIMESTLQPIRGNGGPSFSVSLKIVPTSSNQQDPLLYIPWGRRIFRVRRSMYAQWLSWGTFRNDAELEGLGLAVSEEGNVRDALTISLLALKQHPCWKTLRRFLRVWKTSGYVFRNNSEPIQRGRQDASNDFLRDCGVQ